MDATTIGTTVTRTISVAYAIGVRTAAEAARTRTADDSSLPSARRARTVRAISSLVATAWSTTMATDINRPATTRALTV